MESNTANDEAPITWTFDEASARGKVEFTRGGYGPEFKVTAPDGTIYSGMLDLFNLGAGEDRDSTFQVVVDPVSGGELVQDSDDALESVHVRCYRDGRREVYSES